MGVQRGLPVCRRPWDRRSPGQIEAKLNLALAALEEFDEVGKLAVQASKQLDKLINVGRSAQNKARQALTESIGLLHP